jgi:hypothetical protein
MLGTLASTVGCDNLANHYADGMYQEFVVNGS